MKQSSNEIEKKGRDGTSGDVPVVKRITSSRVESVMNTDVCAREIVPVVLFGREFSVFLSRIRV